MSFIPNPRIRSLDKVSFLQQTYNFRQQWFPHSLQKGIRRFLQEEVQTLRRNSLFRRFLWKKEIQRCTHFMVAAYSCSSIFAYKQFSGTRYFKKKWNSVALCNNCRNFIVFNHKIILTISILRFKAFQKIVPQGISIDSNNKLLQMILELSKSSFPDRK